MKKPINEIERLKLIAGLINEVNYNDSVYGVKRTALTEGKKKEVKEASIDVVNPYQYSMGIQYELEKMDDYSNEALEKAKSIVLKNLAKDQTYYTTLLYQDESPYKFKSSETDAKGMQAKADGHLKKEAKKDEKSNVKDNLGKKEAGKKKPKGVKVMPDKGVTGSEKTIKEGSLNEVILKVYNYDPSSGDLEDVDVEYFGSEDEAKKAALAHHWQIAFDNGDTELSKDEFVAQTKWEDLEPYENYGYDVVSDKGNIKEELEDEDEFDINTAFETSPSSHSYEDVLSIIESYEDERVLNAFKAKFPEGKDISRNAYLKFAMNWIDDMSEVSYIKANWIDITDSDIFDKAGLVEDNVNEVKGNKYIDVDDEGEYQLNDKAIAAYLKSVISPEEIESVDYFMSDNEGYSESSMYFFDVDDDVNKMPTEKEVEDWAKQEMSYYLFSDPNEFPSKEDIEEDIQTSTPEDQFKQLMSKYDWYYEMSDDPRTYDRGIALDKQIMSLGKQIGVDKAVALFNDEAPSDRKITSSFFMESKDKHSKLKEALKDALKKEAIFKNKKGDVVIASSTTSTSELTKSGYTKMPGTEDAVGVKK